MREFEQHLVLNRQSEITVDLQEFLRFLRRSWLLLVLGAIAGTLGGVAYTGLQHPRYEAVARDFVGTRPTSNVGDLTTGATFTQQVVQSYTAVATDPIVLDPVIRSLGLHTTAADLADDITVANPPGTVLIDITATAGNPTTAARIANGVSSSLINAVTGITPGSRGSTPVKITRTAQAVPPTSPVSPRLPVDLAVGVALGLVLALLAALARAILDTRIDSATSIEQITDAPVLGTVPRARRGENPLLTRAQGGGSTIEAFRLLRTNLHFLGVSRGPKAIVITSASAGEGKTTTTSNLAMAMAETEGRVLAVDADLRRPRLDEAFGIDSGVGLTNLLIGEVTIDQAIQQVRDNVFVLPSGPVPPNPTELLQSAAMVELLAQLKERFNTVLLDAAPLGPVADSAILGASADGVLVVAASRMTARPQLIGALNRLGRVNARVLGIVVNRQALPRKAAYSYDYGEPQRPANRKRTKRRSAAPSATTESNPSV